MSLLIRVLIVVGVVVALASGLWLWGGTGLGGDDAMDVPVPGAAIAFAVLGDSDSHSYQDRRSFAPGGELRGGPYRATTLQWTEALARMRGDQLYPGQWGLHGVRRSLALAGRMLGRGPAPPRKEDYRYNFAVSRTNCHDLLGGNWQLARSLAAQMQREPGRWRNGVVVIRIGVNNFGQAQHLEQLASNPAAGEVQREIASCVSAIHDTVTLLHARQPGLRIVLVGIFNNAHWTGNLERWQSPRALANIDAGLEVFNQALRTMAASDRRLAYFDDPAWFRARWGSRDAEGHPAYRSVRIGSLEVTNSTGDAPQHAGLADGHAGTVLNALWAQSLVELLNARFGMTIPPITDDEVLALVQGQPVAVAAPATAAGPARQ